MGVHKKEVYSEIKRLLDIPEDEPIFIIRGQDATAPVAIRNYAQTAQRCGANDVFVYQTYRVADDVELWQSDNPDVVKVPD